MSQSKFIQEEYSKKYRQAANTAVLNVAIGDLVAARKNRRADGGKRLIKSNHSYKNVIASLQSVGVGITYDALMKRVARASVEDSIAEEIRIPKSSAESEVSSLSPHEQADDSLTSKNTAEATLHDDQSLVKSRVGGRPKGNTKAKKKKEKETESKCTDSIVMEYSRRFKASQSVGGKVEYGYLESLIDEKKKEFGVNISISSRNIRNRTHRGLQTAHHGAKSPLEEVEVALVEICIQMGKIRQPLSCTEAITLMNDMIENTNTKQKLIKFQQSRNLGTSGFDKGRVTTGGGEGF
jgi:hypothetical protein